MGRAVKHGGKTVGKMARREFVGGSVFAGLTASLVMGGADGQSSVKSRESPVISAGRPRPNVLWIQTDEQRPDSLGCYGSSWARTPNLDRLAQRGTTFHECHVQSPVCVPSRTSMLMGKYPMEMGILWNETQFKDGVLDPEEKSFVNLFADAGYRTASIGKWHTPNHPTWQENEDFILFNVSGTGKGTVEVADCFSLMAPYSESEHRVIKRKGSSPVIMSGIYPYHDWGATPSGHVTDRAIAWLKEAAGHDQPFFLRVSHLWPHSPVLVPRPWDKLYAPADMPYRPFNRQAYESRSAYDRGLYNTQETSKIPESTWRRILADYYGLCAYLDHEVGRLMRALQALGIHENTVVAFNADHGKSLGEIGLSEKGNFDREVWRVPFLLSFPGHVPENSHRHDLMELMDFGPTLCSLAGIDFPAGMGGRDLFNSSEPEAVFGVIELIGRRRAAIRTRQFRYDYTVLRGGKKAGPDEYDANLIDLDNDPFEEHNLANVPEYAATAACLRERIEQWLASS